MHGTISLYINGKKVTSKVYGNKYARTCIIARWYTNYDLTNDCFIQIEPDQYPPQKVDPETLEPLEAKRQCISVIDLQTGIFYDSIGEAANAKNISKNTLYGYLTKVHPNKTSLRRA